MLHTDIPEHMLPPAERKKIIAARQSEIESMPDEVNSQDESDCQKDLSVIEEKSIDGQLPRIKKPMHGLGAAVKDMQSMWAQGGDTIDYNTY